MTTKSTFPSNHQRFHEKQLDEGLVVAWLSRDLTEPNWDAYLQQAPTGQYQQSSIWAQAKSAEGWKPLRVFFTLNGTLVGGVQILERRGWWGKLAYISKGPVLTPDQQVAQFAVETIRKLASYEDLRALIVQPADFCKLMCTVLPSGNFLPNVLVGIVEATWITDLGGEDFSAIERRIGKWTRKKIRQAKNRNVVVRVAGRDDVGTFFDLMLSTCHRQGVLPNPPHQEALLALWDVASPAQAIRMTLAEIGGRPLAGLICIPFGKTAALWKKGWTSSDGNLHPNELLTHEMFEWANARGYQIADFGSLEMSMAIRMFKGETLTEEQEQTRHVFNIRFGGRPLLLPQSRIYFPNRIVQLSYEVFLRKKLRHARKLRQQAEQAWESSAASNTADSRPKAKASH